MAHIFGEYAIIALPIRGASASMARLNITRMKAILALEDGTIFAGTAFGATGTTTGEICFHTAMTGYQEVISDPTHCGQILIMAYPQIGNYGINEADNESEKLSLSALVVEEHAELFSNWRAEESLNDWLIRHGVPGIEGIDTRKLSRIMRTQGTMRACVSTELSEEEAVAAAKSSAPLAGSELVSKVTTAAPYHWEGESRVWKLPNKSTGDLSNYFELAPATRTVVVYDLGVKRSILRSLRQDGFDVTVVPASTPAETVLGMAPDAVILSNGPGDPSTLTALQAEIAKLQGKLPIFGIALGAQVLGIVLGGSTEQLPDGHHGGNQPIKDLRTGKMLVGSENVTFTIKEGSLSADVEITHKNLNDGAISGFRHKSLPIAGVQFIPSATASAEGTAPAFAELIAIINQTK